MPVCILVCYELVLGISLGTLTVVEMCKTFAKKKKHLALHKQGCVRRFMAYINKSNGSV